MFAAHCTSLPPSLLKAAAELCQQQQQQPIATLLETAYTNLIKGAASSPPTGFETLLGHFIEGPWVALLEAEGRTTFEEGEWETLKKGIASDLKMYSPLPAEAISSLPDYMLKYIKFKVAQAADPSTSYASESGVARLTSFSWKLGAVCSGDGGEGGEGGGEGEESAEE
mmetsp:Transcript_27836/g.55651  ORF Transcript_27836/g.55651 Transcript_27836/m.55651 type:complete len:169 (-) Transcript_27836:305-811(-)